MTTSMFPNAGAPFWLYPDDENKREVWTVGNNVAPGTVVASADGTYVGVTITGSDDFAGSVQFGPYTLSGIPLGGVGHAADQATVATTGTPYLTVEGATTSTVQGTPVYWDATNKELTLTAGGTAVGRVNLHPGMVLDGTHLPVKIGVIA